MQKNRWALFVAVFFLSACSSVQLQRSKLTPPDSEVEVAVAEAEIPPAEGKPKVAVVFGPGGYKTFAYAGFIKGLTQAGVPVDEVVGLEWGSLVAAMYALNAKPHDAEWKLHKLRREDLETNPIFGVGGSRTTKVSHLRKFLRENLGEKSENDTQIPFSCPLLRSPSGSLNWTSSGPLWQRVESCMASPPRFDPSGNEFPASAAHIEVARKLRQQGYRVIIYVSVLQGMDPLRGAGDDWVQQSHWSEIKRQQRLAREEFTDVIEIDTRSFPLFDFQAKTGLQAVGETAAKSAAAELVDKYRF
jgi:hypothetical protein